MYARELALGFSYTWIARDKVGEWESLVLAKKNKNEESPKTPNAGDRRTQKSVELIAELGMLEIGEHSSSELLPGITATDEKSTSKANTESRLPSIQRWLRSMRGAATSANVQSRSVPTYPSITVTRQEGSGDCSVKNAIERLVSLGTMPLGLSEPLRIFLEQNRPPPEWLRARRDWNSFVREQISNSRKYDTMLQVANACRAGLLDSKALDVWKKIESSYEPATRPIFYDTIALETCLTWLKKNVGIVWVEHQAFGAALSQLSGVSYFGPGGLDASGASIANEKADRSVIASVAACGQGFNLQMFSKNLITSCPSGAATIEQVLGRTHRDGQLADEVTVDVLLGCLEQFEAFERALDGATAAEALLGHSQKLLLADVLMPDVSNRKGPLWA